MIWPGLCNKHVGSYTITNLIIKEMDEIAQYSDTIVKPGLKRIKVFLTKLGNPQKKFATILVGGTNGKGSTVSYLYHMLNAIGIKVGGYLSPHLTSLNERILIPGSSPWELKSLMKELESKALHWGMDLSPFELLTSAVFVLFNNYSIDLAIMEVGMGGRWDATNVSHPVASIIVSLGLDHTQYLGHTLSAIALEKLPIGRKGRPLLLGNIPLGGLRAFREGNGALGAVLQEWQRDFFVLEHKEQGFCYVGDQVVSPLVLKLEGRHQWINASLALRTMEVLGFPLTRQALDALQRVWLPARMQVKEVGGVPVVFDVAHNPLALRVLLESLPLRFPERPLWVFFQLLKDKPWQEALKLLLGGFERAFFVDLPRGGREVPGSWIMAFDQVEFVKGRDEWDLLFQEARDRGAVVVFTGSFGMVREGMRWVDGAE